MKTTGFEDSYKEADFFLHEPENNLMSWFLSVPVMQGHGMLVEPPARNSMWRYGFDNPSNNDDNGLFCGGRYVSDFSFVSKRVIALFSQVSQATCSSLFKYRRLILKLNIRC